MEKFHPTAHNILRSIKKVWSSSTKLMLLYYVTPPFYTTLGVQFRAWLDSLLTKNTTECAINFADSVEILLWLIVIRPIAQK